MSKNDQTYETKRLFWMLEAYISRSITQPKKLFSPVRKTKASESQKTVDLTPYVSKMLAILGYKKSKSIF